MKKIYSLIILCLLAAACQQQGMPGSPTDGQPSNIGKTVFFSADDEPLTFLPSVDSSAWTALRSLDERFDACSVPDDLLRRMTTDALVSSAVNYPLNYLIYVYNDPMSAVELIFENSPRSYSQSPTTGSISRPTSMTGSSPTRTRCSSNTSSLPTGLQAGPTPRPRTCYATP